MNYIELFMYEFLVNPMKMSKETLKYLSCISTDILTTLLRENIVNDHTIRSLQCLEFQYIHILECICIR